MVELKMKGFIGNNLFQYAIARIVCQEMGYALRVIESNSKKDFNNDNLRRLLSEFADAPLEVSGQSYETPVDNTFNVDLLKFNGYEADLNKLFLNKKCRKIKLTGSFERYEIFQPYKDEIKKWYHTPSDNLGYKIGGTDVVLHVRWGDFVLEGRAISMSFYTDVLREMNFDKLYVCGYGLGSEVKEALKSFNPIYIQGNVISDFKFIMSFNKIILSPSTFAWWAAFLSDAKEIIAPIPRGNSKGTQLPIDLRVFDESRYKYIENVPLVDREIRIEDIRMAWKMLAHKRKLKWINRWINSQLGKFLIGKVVYKAKRRMSSIIYRFVGVCTNRK